jgi:alanine racemase
VGIIPVGYADGLFRSLSNKASLRIGESAVPIIGRISMDQTILDLSAVKEPREGMAVTVIDNEAGSVCSATNLAKLAGTISYEILTAIGTRVKRTLVE